MRRAPNTAKLLWRVFSTRKDLILARLKLSSKEGRRPNRPNIWRFEKAFRAVAQKDLYSEARWYFKQHVKRNRNQAWKFRFPGGATADEFDKKTHDRLGHISRHERRLIYLYWGYKPGRSGRMCLYVGKTNGHLGRPADHKKILKKYRVTQTWLFQVGSSRKLAAAECLAIHAYGPKENRRKAERPRYQTECEICKRVKKAWREFRPVVRSRET